MRYSHSHPTDHRHEDILHFMREKKDVTLHSLKVTELRHIIPPLLMLMLKSRYGTTKRVKGLWVKKPADWPHDVPFVDPNNACLKSCGGTKRKPKKDELKKMLAYIFYRTNYSDSSSVDLLNLPASLKDTALLRSFYEACDEFKDVSPIELFDEDSSYLHEVLNTDTAALVYPQQVMDVEENLLISHPVQTILTRIETKLNNIVQDNSCSPQQLTAFHTTLTELQQVKGEEALVRGHELEKSLDLHMFRMKFSAENQQKSNTFQFTELLPQKISHDDLVDPSSLPGHDPVMSAVGCRSLTPISYQSTDTVITVASDQMSSSSSLIDLEINFDGTLRAHSRQEDKLIYDMDSYQLLTDKISSLGQSVDKMTAGQSADKVVMSRTVDNMLTSNFPDKISASDTMDKIISDHPIIPIDISTTEYADKTLFDRSNKISSDHLPLSTEIVDQPICHDLLSVIQQPLEVTSVDLTSDLSSSQFSIFCRPAIADVAPTNILYMLLNEKEERMSEKQKVPTTLQLSHSTDVNSSVQIPLMVSEMIEEDIMEDKQIPYKRNLVGKSRAS